jgi:hypothetical protein
MWNAMPSLEAWQWHAARELYLLPQDLERIARLRGIRWDPRQGTFVFTN